MLDALVLTGLVEGMAAGGLTSYKRLFSHREMVEDLLRGFVHEPWVAELDFATLIKVSGSYVSDDLRDREDDVIWWVRWGREWLYVYLLIEFQSEVIWHMAVRIMVYVGLLYQDLIKSRQLDRRGRLPPVLPIVLYNGEQRWSAAADVAELIEPLPAGLERYRPQLRYLVLDEGRYRDEELSPLKNLVAAVFRLENSRTPDDIVTVLAALLAWLDTPEQAELRRAFATWLQRVLLPRRLPQERFPELNELSEVHAMLAKRVEEWTRQWREDGRKEGRKLGRQEGEALFLIRLLEHRFGPLSEVHRDRIHASDAETLLVWGERVFTAESVDDVLK